jgi:hypothetical protein
VRRQLEKKEILAAHRNAQRLLRPLRVVNPFACQLTFLDDRTRTRRDHEKYLTLIDAIAFLHQYQRPVRRDGQNLEYVEVTVADIARANRIAGEVLGRSLDELPPQSRRLLLLIEEQVNKKCEEQKIEHRQCLFSRRDLRQWVGWSDTALKIHLHRLEEMEYLLIHRTARGQGYLYEMLYSGEGQDGNRFIMGLIDAGQLNTDYDFQRSGQNGAWSGGGQPLVRGVSGGGQGVQNGFHANGHQGRETDEAESTENIAQGELSYAR